MSARRRCLPRFTRRGLWGALLLAVATFNIVLLRSRAFAPTAARPSAARGSAAPRPPPSASPEPAPATTAVPRPRHNVPEPDHDDGGSAGHVRRYNVVWASPSNSSAGSMPLGNGDVALNVWVTGDGAVHLLISKADAFDENHSLLKLALVSVTLRPSPFRAGPFFNQTLDLLTGTVYADLGGAGRGDTQAAVRVWVDAHSPTVNVQVRCQGQVANLVVFGGGPVHCVYFCKLRVEKIRLKMLWAHSLQPKKKSARLTLFYPHPK